MIFTTEEQKELAKIANLSDTELAGYKRQITAEEGRVFDQTVQELFEQGFSVTKTNVQKLYSAFDSNPQVPINRANILATTTQYRDEYDWKSPEEIEYNNLQVQLGPDQSELLHRLLKNHGLIDNEANFILLGNFHLKNRWPINANTFQRGIDALRFTPQGYKLLFALTPDEVKAKREAKEARERANAAPKKTPLEIAKLRADQVRGLKDANGRDLADIEMERFYETHPIEQAPAPAPAADDSVNSDNSMWQRRTLEYIQSLQGNLLRQEATGKFGKQAMNGYWKVNWISLDSWLTRRKSGGKD